MKSVLLVVFFLLILTDVQSQYIPKFDLQGHRGARGLKPENSIPAFIKALELGVTTIEMDVVITKDKQVLVSHEPYMASSICQTLDGKSLTDPLLNNIYKLTYEETKSFDCGSKGNERFPEQEKEAVFKPLLKDVIVAVENHIKNYTQYEADYNIEIKSTPEGDRKFHPAPEEYSDLVYSLIDQYLAWDRIVIQSFDMRVLRYWHQKYPKVRLALLEEKNGDAAASLMKLGFVPSVYSPEFTLLSKEEVERLHALTPAGFEKPRAKLRVIPWTVNEIKDMESMKALGVDGIISDYPNRAAEIGLGLKGKK